MDYSFNIELAQKYGVEEAVFLNHLLYWTQHNEANGKNFHEGRYWTYNSAQAFTTIFPFWSRKKIDRIIQALTDSGAIYVGNFNADGRDRTRWFALDESVICIGQNRPMDCPKASNGLPESVQPLPDSKPNINTDKKTHIDDFEKAICNFIEHRKKLKKPMTEHAVDLLRKELEKLAPGDKAEQISLIEYAIKKAWLGVYPKNEYGNGGKKPEKKSAPTDADYEHSSSGYEIL